MGFMDKLFGKKSNPKPTLYVVKIPELRILVSSYLEVIADAIAESPPQVNAIFNDIYKDAAILNDTWVDVANNMANNVKGSRVDSKKIIGDKTYLLTAINVPPEDIKEYFLPRGYKAEFFDQALEHKSGLFVHIVAVPISPNYADFIVFVSFGDPTKNLIVLAQHLV